MIDLRLTTPAPPAGPDTGASGELWLSLAAAARLLGSPPSTVRRWADQGRLAVRRTPGGHRRFSRASVLALGPAAGPPAAPPLPADPLPWPLDPATLARQEWHVHFASPTEAGRMRELGQRLLGLLIQYLIRREEDARFLAEGREIGTAYGTAAGQSAASLPEMVEAFLFFRSSFMALALQVPAAVQAKDAGEFARLWQRADRFMNEVLLGTIRGYEAAARAHRAQELPAPWK
ncbi:MAG TPA: helix-turn-helix domain-containing protein [Chloroflexia bacterium]|nr:helix-turn-helix domain-containing protein [Chloroflexia bacterium]